MNEKIKLAPEIQRELHEIANDNISGASLLFHRLLHVFPTLTDSLEKPEIATNAYLFFLADVIYNLRPCMAPFAQLSNYLRLMAENNFDRQVVRSAFAALPHSYTRQFKREKENIIRFALQQCKNFRKILVHSRSSLVESFISHWLKQDRQREVWITESRPLCEGTMLAKAFSNLPNRKVLLVDDARGLALQHVNAVVIGADRVSETYIMNKIGSRSLALLAKASKKPVFALAETIKFLPERFKLPKEPGHPFDEIGLPANKVDGFNYYFEPVPIGHCRRIITSFGACNKTEINRIFNADRWNAFLIEQVSSY